MTTERSVASELEDVSEEVLSALDASERVRMIFEAEADGNHDRASRLVDSTPRSTYKRPDHRYTNRALFAQSEAQSAAYAMQTAWLKFRWMDEATRHCEFQDLFGLVPDTLRDPPDEYTDIDGVRSFNERWAQLKHQRLMTLVDLYIHYHAYHRFANEAMGLTLEEFFAPAPRDFDLGPIKETLEMAEHEINDLSETAEEDDLVPPPQEIADQEYEHLAKDWANADDPKQWNV